MAFVYWIHLPEHVDLLTEGYIGICGRTVGRRFRQHLTAAEKNSHLVVHRAIRKYKDKIVVNAYIFPNGNVIAFNKAGQQVPEYQDYDAKDKLKRDFPDLKTTWLPLPSFSMETTSPNLTETSPSSSSPSSLSVFRRSSSSQTM